MIKAKFSAIKGTILFKCNTFFCINNSTDSVTHLNAKVYDFLSDFGWDQWAWDPDLPASRCWFGRGRRIQGTDACPKGQRSKCLSSLSALPDLPKALIEVEGVCLCAGQHPVRSDRLQPADRGEGEEDPRTPVPVGGGGGGEPRAQRLPQTAHYAGVSTHTHTHTHSCRGVLTSWVWAKTEKVKLFTWPFHPLTLRVQHNVFTAVPSRLLDINNLLNSSHADRDPGPRNQSYVAKNTLDGSKYAKNH